MKYDKEIIRKQIRNGGIVKHRGVWMSWMRKMLIKHAGMPPKESEFQRRCNEVNREIAVSFKIGDKVRWTSQSAGYTKTKVGVVVAVVPTGTYAHSLVPDFHSLYAGHGTRNHESYLVKVGNSKNLYWPRVSMLHVAPKDAK